VTIIELRKHRFEEPLGNLALGFLDAAAGLFQRANNHVGEVDWAFYPAAHCFRHGLELFIKQMSIYVAYERRDAKLLYERGHRLKAQWERIKADADSLMIRAQSVEEDLGMNLEEVDLAIDEVDLQDPSGDVFRYPESVLPANAKRLRTRNDTPPRTDANLADWVGLSTNTLEAVRIILYAAQEFAYNLASERAHVIDSFHQTVIRFYATLNTPES